MLGESKAFFGELSRFDSICKKFLFVKLKVCLKDFHR